jgi:hypothetical protein
MSDLLAGLSLVCAILFFSAIAAMSKGLAKYVHFHIWLVGLTHPLCMAQVVHSQFLAA